MSKDYIEPSCQTCDWCGNDIDEDGQYFYCQCWKHGDNAFGSFMKDDYLGVTPPNISFCGGKYYMWDGINWR